MSANPRRLRAEPFQTIWADIGDAETSLLLDVFGDAVKLHGRLRANREAGKPFDAYAEHMALSVESRLRAVLAHSPHLLANFTPAGDQHDRQCSC